MKVPDTRWGAILTLCRISNAPTVWSNVLAGWFLAGGGFEWRLPVMLLGATALYCGGTTLNDAFDAAFDRRYRPERPIPRGVFTRTQVWAIGVGWLVPGSLLALFAGGAELLLLALLACIVGYDWLHKRKRQADLLMGGGRASLVLLAGSANGLGSFPLWVWAAAHLSYITGLTWLAAGESGPRPKADQRREQTLLLLSPLAATLVLILLWRADGLAYPPAIALAAFFLAWIAPALPARGDPMPAPRGIPRLLAGIVIIDAIALCWANPPLAVLVVLVLLPLTRMLQQKIAAT